MKTIARTVGVSIAAAALLIGAAGCGNATQPNGNSSSSTGGSGGGSVYFLNFKPEVADQYGTIIAEYKKETGVDVKIQTAAAGTYEQTLTSEMAKSDPPTIFQINGPVGYSNWKDYTADLTNSEIYKHLSDQSLAVSTADGVWGVPYVEEGYGIIYNDAIMKKYFALPDKKVSITSTDQITSYDLLKQVVEDMTAHKADLGIQGVFADTSLKPGEDWRWQTHLVNVPLFYEFQQDKVDLTQGTPATIKFTYGDNMKNLFDLYLNNSTTDPGQLGSKTVDDSMAEFAAGQAAMVQNGDWAWSQIDPSAVDGSVVQAADVHLLPLYMGIQGEEDYGIPVGTENYFSINAKADPADQQASLDFLTWLFSSDYGKKAVSNDLGFIAPFDWFTPDEAPNNPLASDVIKWMNGDKPSVSWSPFQVIPSEDWKNSFGGDLLSYAQGTMDWPTVESTMVSDWASQAASAS